MTDSLRARIIAALARADQDWCSDNNLHEDMADAVIRELGLDGHTESFIDADGDKRCSTCDKWLEPGQVVNLAAIFGELRRVALELAIESAPMTLAPDAVVNRADSFFRFLISTDNSANFKIPPRNAESSNFSEAGK